MKIFFVIFINFVCIISANAITLKGKVLERGTKKPLENINVYILPLELSATTNNQGEFEILDVPEGNFKWVVNIPGYIRFEELDDTDDPSSIFYIERFEYKIYETTVTSTQKKRDDSTQTLTQADFLMAPGAGQDPIRAVQNLTGVAQNQSAQVVIQGSNPDDTGYLINQHPVPLVFHFDGLSSVVFPNAVESVDYLSAGYGPEYGRAIGGLIGINTKSPQNDRQHGIAYLDIFNAGVLAEGPLTEDKKQTYLVSLRRSYIGQVLSKVTEDNEDFNFTVAPTYTDLTAIYENKIDEKNIFKLDLVASQDELKFLINKPINDDPKLRGEFFRQTQFFRIIPKYTRKINSHSEMDNSFAFGPDKILLNLNNQKLDINSWNFSTRSEWRNRFNENYKIYLGLDSLFDRRSVFVNLSDVYTQGGVSNPYSTGEIASTDIKSSSQNLGFYLRNEIKISETSPWTFFPGLRFDYFDRIKEGELSPRANLKYQVNDSLFFRLAAGLYYQPPSGRETDKNYGNPELTSPRSSHYTFGWQKDFRGGSSDGVIWNSGIFYKNLDRLVVSSTALTNRDGSQVQENYNNQGTGTIYGLEQSVKWKKNEYRLTLAYTLLKSTREEPSVPKYPSEFDQTHNLNLIGSYERGKWIYSTRLRYVTGNPYTPVESSYYDADNNVYIPLRGEIYSERLGNFVQLDFRIDRKIVYDKMLLYAYLDIQNLSNNKNEQAINYSYDYSQSQPTTGLPIIPIFGVRGEF
ncbi:MAG: carboxypeptidase-like regulatory domain-containing protein [Bacteriovoracaceae bacterium]|nr:carboxypeptidase-like regulatory domain-containing protein [Bacteriovoracaceae bacterium]